MFYKITTASNWVFDENIHKMHHETEKANLFAKYNMHNSLEVEYSQSPTNVIMIIKD